MENILVAIDFSKNAEHALQYALMYAQKMDSSLYLIWVDNSTSDEGLLDTIDRDLRKEKKEYLNNLVSKYSEKYAGIRIEILLRKGRVYQEISKAASHINADMIFTGTHGVSGYEQHWIGSNTYRIVTHAPCPVATIRGSYEITGELKNILVPLDSSLETKQKLPFICELATRFDARIHLLEIYTSNLSVIRKRIHKFGEEAVNCMIERGVEYELEKLDVKNVVSSIIEYGNDNNIDLIAIMTEQDSTTANKFLGPYAQQLINNSKIPVVSVRAKG